MVRSVMARGAALLLVAAAVGCGGGGVHRVSGTVKFKDQPVPAGKVYIFPDASKGNTGPSGFADIKNGSFDTAYGGKGAVAGPVVFAVEGVDPNAAPDKADPSGDVQAKLLFARYELTAELPAAASTKEIAVPADAAKGPVAPKTGFVSP